MQEITLERRAGWSLNRWIVLLVLGALAGLLLEIRYTHRHVLGEHPLSFTPLIYSGLMLLAGAVALLLWDKGGRRALFWCFAIGLIVGPLGLWLHTMGHPFQGLGRELSAWTMPIPSGDEGDKSGGGQSSDQKKSGGDPKGGGHPQGGGHPPVMAPLSFLGLGVLGMLACAGRFQPRENESL